MSGLSYQLEEKTAQSIHENRHMLEHMAAEHVNAELRKLLAGDLLRQYSDVLRKFWPELGPPITLEQNNPWYCLGGWEHAIHAVEAAPADLVLRDHAPLRHR